MNSAGRRELQDQEALQHRATRARPSLTSMSTSSKRALSKPGVKARDMQVEEDAANGRKASQEDQESDAEMEEPQPSASHHRSRSRMTDTAAGDVKPRDPLRELPLLAYLESLDNSPACVVDIAMAGAYGALSESGTHTMEGLDNLPPRPIRVFNNEAMGKLLQGRKWLLDALDARSRRTCQSFLLDLYHQNPVESVTYSFLSDSGPSIPVEFTVGTVRPQQCSRAMREQYPAGLAVLVGRFRARRRTSGPSDTSSSKVPRHNLSASRNPIASPPPKVTDITLTQIDSPGFTISPSTLPDTDTGRMFLTYPWHETALGPVNDWDSQMRAHAVLCLSIPIATNIGLGSSLCLVYNDSYSLMLGEMHPRIFGLPMAEAWGDTWTQGVEPMVSKVMKERVSLSRKNHLVWLHRLNKYEAVEDIKLVSQDDAMSDGTALEETYHTFSYSPLLSADGHGVLGFIGQDIETTDTVVAQRRLSTIRELSLQLGRSLTYEDYYRNAQASLEENAIDIPFFLVYSCTMAKGGEGFTYSTLDKEGTTTRGSVGHVATADDTHTETASLNSGSMLLQLKAHGGLKPESEERYKAFILDFDDLAGTADQGMPFPFLEAVLGGIDPKHTYMDATVADGFIARSWGQQAHQVVLCPIIIDQKIAPEAVLVLGLNSRRSYNRSYQRFIEEISRCMVGALSTVKSIMREQKLLDSLRRLDAAKTAFFTGISHELRSPLQLIAGPAADALAEDLPKKDRARFQLISRATGRLLRLVNSLMDYASLEAGRHSLSVQPVYLGTYTADLASLFRSAIERSGIQYNVSCEGDELAYTDTAAYEKIVYNLISNATKYTTSGKIDVRFRKEDSHFVLEVQDTGIGIPVAEVSKVFQRFHRVNNKYARSIEGTGIGLSICRELARIMKGELSVESKETTHEQQGGSLFRLRLPCGYAHFPEEVVRFTGSAAKPDELEQTFSKRAIADELQGAWESHSIGSLDDGGGDGGDEADALVTEREANVLVVDDNSDVRTYVAGILGGICRSVTAVVDGQDAWEILKTNVRIDLVVSDVMMPRMDGFQLLERIRNDETRAQTPVILLSARAGSEATAEGLATGATDYLPKPFASRELVARARNALATAKNSKRLQTLVAETTQQLLASEKKAQHLMSILPVGLYEATAEGTVLWANEAWHRMSDWPAEKMPFHVSEWFEKVRSEDRQKVMEICDNAFNVYQGVRDVRDTPLHADWQWCRPGQDPAWCYGQLHPFGEGFVGLLTDITSAKRLDEQNIAHEKQRAEDALNLARSQEGFLDIVSHELRNPLSSVLNSADLATSNHEAISNALDRLTELATMEEMQTLLEEAKSELDEAAESVQGIIVSARHQSLIAGDILSVSRYNRGLLTITDVPVSLTSELQTIVSMFVQQTRTSDIHFDLRFGPEISPKFCVAADPTRLSQIIINLVSNSLRILENHDGTRNCAVEVHALPYVPDLDSFHGKGTDSALSDISSAPGLPTGDHPSPPGTDVWLLFLVRDSGPGISHATQARLFTKFNSVGTDKGVVMDATRSAVGGGAGLGLYLAKKLVELMGGRITVVSEEGKGADFIFFTKSSMVRPFEPKKYTSSRSRLRPPKIGGARTGSRNSARSSFSSDPESTRGSASLQITSASASGKHEDALSDGSDLPSRLSLHVMIAEDNLLNQKLLHKQLTKAGVEAKVANNGQEAIDRIIEASQAGHRINVLLLDLEMPVLGGIDTAIRLREMERTGSLPGKLYIFAVTGNVREHYITSSINAGMDSVIEKPYRIADILSKLDALQL